ncbi:alpha/beta hydrolase [Pontibacter arcticus]|uniref:BD-FAE-like domain-containing protein n=1 Tax=Pontibacter arcticus TaxID=2080288 RepID=A0A364RFL7_9BACT|nr:alpha/beta hydrolase [Pontibacter arcticus]RAU83089.1 hypothetical protein DP923_07620 [Pontibacter arcticus]
MKVLLAFLFTFSFLTCFGQASGQADSLKNAYLSEMKVASDVFTEAFYLNRPEIYSLAEKPFLQKVEALKKPFVAVTDKYSSRFQSVDADFILHEKRDIGYFFDQIIVNYPYFHENHTGRKVKLSKAEQTRLDQHVKDFNTPELLSSSDFKGYVQAFLRHQSTIEVNKPKYRKSDNKRLDAYLSLIPAYFKKQTCKEYWQYHYLIAHLDDWGSKNTEKAVKSFLATATNAEYKKTVDSIYTASASTYKGHIIKTYKTVDGSELDLHIFLPDSAFRTTKRPVMVYFSGGSWTKGTPEWDFYNCENYAKKGWVAVAVEYRVADRHETTPFEAVKDARSAIRWLRQHAATYTIDPSRIVASGNSAGGHLVLSAALSSEINEKTDNQAISAVPDLLLVNSGVYNLYADGSTDWISKGQKDKTLVKKISPQHLLTLGLPPALIIHGTNDQSVAYTSAKAFSNEMKRLNNTFEFHTLDGAPHYIWYDRSFSGTVANLRKAFLLKYGYDL